MKAHDKDIPAEIRALRRSMARGASVEAREDFAQLERMLDAGECLQPYELELVRDDALSMRRWEHVRACIACQLMLDGARLPEGKEAAPPPIPAELVAAVHARVDAVLASLPPRRTELRNRAPVLALAAALVLFAGVGHIALRNADRAALEAGTEPTAAEMFVRLKQTQPIETVTMTMDWSASGVDGAAYLEFARRLKDKGALGDAALALCIAEGLSRDDPVLAERVDAVARELREAADVSGK